MTEQTDQIMAAQPAEVHRGLNIERDGGRQNTVQTISQSYRTSVEDLWEACTHADRLARWFAPVRGDLRLGGRYQVEGNASGEVLACQPPQSYTVSWEFGGDVSQVTVSVAPDGDRARVTIEHQHAGDADSAFWTQFGPGATGVGWDLALLGLAFYLIAGRDRPEDPNAFVGSAPAQTFVRAVSESWGEASVRAGTPPADAAAAADRTTAFYLGIESA